MKRVLILFGGVFILSFLFIPTLALQQNIDQSKVITVVDGDTIKVSYKNTKETVRLIGVDTPELHHPNKPVMYYAQEAYKFTKGMVENRNVRLEFDENNSASHYRDKYGRLLAYVYLTDGTSLNAELIKQGYGLAYTKFPFKHISAFRNLQQNAIEDKNGLWGKTIGSPEISNLIMKYESLNAQGKELTQRYIDSLVSR